MAPPRVVVIGAGIVGCSLADELTERGWTDVTVLDQGPLFSTGGSSSHAPGLVFQTNPSQDDDRARAVHGREVLRPRPRRAVVLQPGRRPRGRDDARALGRPAPPARLRAVVGRRGRAARRPRRSAPGCTRSSTRDQVLGGLHVASDGLAKALRAGEAQARRAIERGARFLAAPRASSTSPPSGGRVTGVVTDQGVVPADLVVSCAGFWGAEIGTMVGLTVPLLPMAHQYARTGQVPGLATTRSPRRPCRSCATRTPTCTSASTATGSASAPTATARCRSASTASATTTGRCRRCCPSPRRTSPRPGSAAAGCCPALADTKVEEGFNGIFSFTPDGAAAHRRAPRPAPASGSPRRSG